MAAFSGSFTYEQLEAGGPLILTTPPEAPWQITISVDGEWHLSDLWVDA